MIKKINKGFTLIEMLVVIAIIAILGAVSAPGIMSKINDARAAQIISNIDTLTVAVAAEISSNLDSDYRQIASMKTLKKNKRIKSQVVVATQTDYMPGPWKSKMFVSADATSEGAFYYITVLGVKSKEACIAISSYLSKKAITWDVVSGTGVTGLGTYVKAGAKAGEVVSKKVLTELAVPNATKGMSPNQSGTTVVDCAGISGSNKLDFNALFE